MKPLGGGLIQSVTKARRMERSGKGSQERHGHARIKLECPQFGTAKERGGRMVSLCWDHFLHWDVTGANFPHVLISPRVDALNDCMDDDGLSTHSFGGSVIRLY